MEWKSITEITREWEKVTDRVLDLEKFEFSHMQQLLKDTYEILYKYHQENLVPKAVCKLLLEVDAFLYFVSLMEGKEVGVDYYRYRYIDAIVQELKAGFFNGAFKNPFPIIVICDDDKNEITVNFDEHIF